MCPDRELSEQEQICLEDVSLPTLFLQFRDLATMKGS